MICRLYTFTGSLCTQSHLIMVIFCKNVYNIFFFLSYSLLLLHAFANHKTSTLPHQPHFDRMYGVEQREKNGHDEKKRRIKKKIRYTSLNSQWISSVYFQRCGNIFEVNLRIWFIVILWKKALLLWLLVCGNVLFFFHPRTDREKFFCNHYLSMMNKQTTVDFFRLFFHLKWTWKGFLYIFPFANVNTKT